MVNPTARGLLIAAPASGSGKTVVTLALLRHLRARGITAASIKTGPDYIDPAFHSHASGRPCLNLDSWAMRRATLASLVARASADAELVVGEGVMGLFDGAPGGAGSTAELAQLTGWPVVLVVDARGMAASAGALLAGFHRFHPEVRPAAVIFNRVGGPGHIRILHEAAAPLGLKVLGCLPRSDKLALPERHLGLVQAAEHAGLDRFLDCAAELVGAHLEIDALVGLARPARLDGGAAGPPRPPLPPLPPLGQHIAVAHDLAFAFVYPFVLDGWRAAGATVTTFSPLADQPPDGAADAVYLPGGYPELHGGRLAANRRFADGLHAAAARGALVYGECGGFMALGRGLIDGTGTRHAMADLLPLETSFAEPRLTLGYRQVETVAAGPLGPAGSAFRGHEFHYARPLAAAGVAPALFRSRDAGGKELETAGLQIGRVLGSFVHLIDRVADDDGADRRR